MRGMRASASRSHHWFNAAVPDAIKPGAQCGVQQYKPRPSPVSSKEEADTRAHQNQPGDPRLCELYVIVHRETAGNPGSNAARGRT